MTKKKKTTIMTEKAVTNKSFVKKNAAKKKTVIKKVVPKKKKITQKKVIQKKPINKSPKKAIRKKQETSPKIKEENIRRTKVRVIGIGGGGSSIVSEISSKLKKATFVVANTDKQDLKKVSSSKVITFSFGEVMTHGLGTGMDPDLGREAALEAEERIKKLVEGQDLCIFVSCLAGGTGSGALPVFAKISKDLGNLNYGIFTLPFEFEGAKKMEVALESLDKSKRFFNALTVIPNEKVFNIVDKNTPIKKVFSTINQNLVNGLAGLIEMIYKPGLINIDFADLRKVLESVGKVAYLNTIESEKDGFSAEDLVRKLILNPLYSYSITGATGILLNICGEKNLSLSEVDKISREISDTVNKDARIIFGVSQNAQNNGKIKISLLATGCSFRFSLPQSKINQTKKKKKTVKKVEEKKEEKPLENIAKEEVETKPEKKVVTKKKIKKVIADKEEKKEEKKEENLVEKKIEKKESEEGFPVLKDNNPKFALKTERDIIKKNGLQLKQDTEDAEAEILAEEKIWEVPAYLRNKKNL